MLGRACVILFALAALTAAAGPPPASSAPKKNSAPKSAAKPPKAQKKGAPKISPLPGSILRLAEGRKYRKLAEALEGRTSEWGGRRAFLLGYAYLKLDRPADALNLMKRALRRAPELRVHILRFMGTAALAVQDDDAAREALEQNKD